MQNQAPKTRDIQYWVTVPLKFTYRSKPDGTVVETYCRTMDLPIMDIHLKDIKRLIRKTHVSSEQALACLILAHVEDKEEQYNKEEQEYDPTITINGKLIYNKDLLTNHKLFGQS